MNRLADLRPGITNLDEAKAAMADIAKLTCRIEYQKARLEKQVADLKTRLVGLNAQEMEHLAEREKALTVFITSHPELFQKPRKVVTEFGSFGLQAVCEVVIENEEAVTKWLVAQSFEECFVSELNLVRKAIKTRLEAKENIPGCTLKTGDTAVYKVAKTLIDETREKALE